MCPREENARKLVKEAIVHFTSKKKCFSARDVRMWIRINKNETIEDQGRLVLESFFKGNFPDGYIVQMCRYQDKVFAIYRYTRYAKAYDFSGLIRNTDD